MMMTTLAAVGLVALAVADSDDSNAELFRSLDTNGDGIVDASEVQEPQQVWFTRALRVGDANEDGRLTPDELQNALADPEPRQPPRDRRQGQFRRIDPQRLDRNGDGRVTLEEVPEPGRERFQQLLRRTGQESVTVEQLTEMMKRGRPPGQAGRQGEGKETAMEMEITAKPGSGDKAGRNSRRQKRPGDKAENSEMRRRVMQGFRRLDTNSDGRVTRREARNASQFIDRFDQNNDGVVERSELPGSADAPGRTGGPDSGSGRKRSGNGQDDGQRRPGGRAMLERLDRNGDGQISRDEAPQRMKQNFDRIDANGDGQLTPQELQQAMRRRDRKPGGKQKN